MALENQSHYKICPKSKGSIRMQQFCAGSLFTDSNVFPLWPIILKASFCFLLFFYFMLQKKLQFLILLFLSDQLCFCSTLVLMFLIYYSFPVLSFLSLLNLISLFACFCPKKQKLCGCCWEWLSCNENWKHLKPPSHSLLIDLFWIWKDIRKKCPIQT